MLFLNHFLYQFLIFTIFILLIRLNEASVKYERFNVASIETKHDVNDVDQNICNNCKLIKCSENYNLNNEFENYCCSMCIQLNEQNNDESNDKDDDDDDDNNVDSFTNTKIIISTAKRKNRSISPDNGCSHINCLENKYRYYKENSTCPSDSDTHLATEDEKRCCDIDFKCECKECSDSAQIDCKLLRGNFEPVRMRIGNNNPGTCCDFYVCDQGNYTCNYNGIFHRDKAEWEDGCNQCICKQGITSCMKKICQKEDCEVKKYSEDECCPKCTGECKSLRSDNYYKSGDSWSEDDDCTHCTCNDGRKSCLSVSCRPPPCANPIKIPGQCCRQCKQEEITRIEYPPHCKPLIANFSCSLACEYGVKLNGNRCPICQCADKPIEKCSFPCDPGLAYVPLNKRMCRCTSQCQTKCSIICLNGYEKGPDGCDICKCNEENIPFSEHSCYNHKTGQEHVDGVVWFDGCRQCMCKNDRQYCSLISCNIKCTKPIYLPDRCCPVCPEDDLSSKIQLLNTTICYSPKSGNIYNENEMWNLDKCTKCICRNGIVLCEISQCPATACPLPIYNSNDTCCPICPTMNQLPVPFSSQISNLNTKKVWSCFDTYDQRRPHGSTWKESDCTHCVCINGERKCYQEICQKIICSQKILKKGQCCSYCLDNVTSPYQLLNTFIENISTVNTTTAQQISIMPTKIILIILVSVILLLILLVLILIFYTCILRKNVRNTSSIKLTSSSTIEKDTMLPQNNHKNKKKFHPNHTNDDESKIYTNETKKHNFKKKFNCNKNPFNLRKKSHSKNKTLSNGDTEHRAISANLGSNGHISQSYMPSNKASTLSPLIMKSNESRNGIYYV